VERGCPGQKTTRHLQKFGGRWEKQGRFPASHPGQVYCFCRANGDAVLEAATFSKQSGRWGIIPHEAKVRIAGSGPQYVRSSPCVFAVFAQRRVWVGPNMWWPRRKKNFFCFLFFLEQCGKE